MGNMHVSKTPSPGSARAGAVCLAAALAAFGQSDPLISKTIPRLFSAGPVLWAFAEDGSRYSRVDLFSDPVAIRNSDLKLNGPVLGGAGRASSLALFFDYAKNDSMTVAGVLSLDAADKAGLDSLIFKRSSAHNSAVTRGAEITSLALARDTVVLGAGTAGFAVGRALADGKSGVLSGDTLVFRALKEGSDSAREAFRCALNSTCVVDNLDAAAGNGADSVITVAIDSASADSVWLLLGTKRGLRRGLIGSAVFPQVALPNQAGQAVRVDRVQADSRRSLLWVFTGSHYYFSDDHGRSFRVPPKVSGVEADPASFTGYNPAPEALSVGDTTYVNFNLDFPGLILFRRDTLLANAGTDTLGRVLLDAEDGLNISRGEGRLTSLALVRNGNATALAVGSAGKGLFYRKPATGGAGDWTNINSLKRLSGGLDEIITFPTLFTGATAGGEPEYVHLGYRLKQDGRVTITVYNYAMEKVRTLVKDSPRKGGGSRSENSIEDRWDGRDSSGRPVSVGVYYILIESDQGEKGWGKAIAGRGRE
jgi:hypothetical protein